MLEEAEGLAKLLQFYGGWGLSTVLMFAIAYLLRLVMLARDSTENSLRESVKESVAIISDFTKSTEGVRSALEKIAESLRASERRLEIIERRLSREE